MDRRVKRLIVIMKDSLAHKLSERTLSGSVNLSPPRLRQLFKKDTGLSPIQYLRRLRTKRAAYLLRTSFLTIKEVAFHTGSGDVSHFVRDFKKQYGVTPSDFRVRTERSPLNVTCDGKTSE